MAPLLAEGKIATDSLIQDDRSAVDNPFSTINRLDKLAGEIEVVLVTYPVLPPIVQEPTVPWRAAPPLPKKEPLSSPVIATLAVISRTGNEIIRPECAENRKNDSENTVHPKLKRLSQDIPITGNVMAPFA